MKRINIAAVFVCVLLWTVCGSAVQPLAQSRVAESDAIGRAFKDRISNIQVEGRGVVTRVLDDDLRGSRHQRFIVRLPTRQTILIAHNIDLAPRIPVLRKGDIVSFYGEYVWSEKGGTVHWTHLDPQGRHVAGWLKHKGRTYQ